MIGVHDIKTRSSETNLRKDVGQLSRILQTVTLLLSVPYENIRKRNNKIYVFLELYTNFSTIILIEMYIKCTREKLPICGSNVPQLPLQEHERSALVTYYYSRKQSMYTHCGQTHFLTFALGHALCHRCAIRRTATGKHQTCVLMTTGGCCPMYIGTTEVKWKVERVCVRCM